MKDSLIKRVDLFIANTQEIKSEFVWQNTMMKHMAALLYASEDKIMNTDAIQYCADIITANTGVFSVFRGNALLNVAAMLSLNDKPEEHFADIVWVYDSLKKSRFHASDYLTIAACQLVLDTNSADLQKAVDRMRLFYRGMKERHPFLTSIDDYVFSAMLGLSDLDIKTGIDRIERIYKTLKPEFFSGNGVQALSQMLILCEKPQEAVSRVLALKLAFRTFGMKLESVNTISSLGVLALLPGVADEIARSVVEVYEYLREQKGFGAWSFSKQELELYASALVAYEYVDAIKNGLLSTVLSTSITNIIIAQQAAISAAISASAAAASSGS